MKKRLGCYPRVRVEGSGRGVVTQAGSVLLVETARKSGLDSAISAALTPWHKPRAVHDPRTSGPRSALLARQPRTQLVSQHAFQPLVETAATWDEEQSWGYSRL